MAPDSISVLEMEPDNFKAVFRRGIAHTALENFQAAQEDLISGNGKVSSL